MNKLEAKSIIDNYKEIKVYGNCDNCGESFEKCHCGDYIDTSLLPQEIQEAYEVINKPSEIELEQMKQFFQN